MPELALKRSINPAKSLAAKKSLLESKLIGIGGERRNRPEFPAVAPLICLIPLANQHKPA
jgi:hypothetical protein